MAARAYETREHWKPLLHGPKTFFFYEDPSVHQLAACYAFGLVSNHPFIDGNKRIAFMAAFTFLGINGYNLIAPEEEAAVFTLALAAREMEEAAYAQWLSHSSTPI